MNESALKSTIKDGKKVVLKILNPFSLRVCEFLSQLLNVHSSQVQGENWFPLIFVPLSLIWTCSFSKNIYKYDICYLSLCFRIPRNTDLIHSLVTRKT